MNVSNVLTSDMVIVDEQTKKVSILGVFDNMESAKIPFNTPKFSYIAFIERESTDEDLNHVLLKCTLNKTKVFEQNLIIDFKGKTKNRVILLVDSLPVNDFGLLKFQLTHPKIKGNTSTTIEIKSRTLPVGQPVVIKKLAKAKAK